MLKSTMKSLFDGTSRSDDQFVSLDMPLRIGAPEVVKTG